MPVASPAPVRRRLVPAGAIVFSLVFAALVVAAGCSKDDDKNPVAPGGGTPSTSFTGFMTDGLLSGKVVITVSSTSLAGRPRVLPTRSASVTASVTFTFDGATVTATGTYDDVNDSLEVSGSGYSFHGKFEPGTDIESLVGTFDGPSSSGFFAGIGGLTAPKVYCGTWHSATLPDSGTFNFVAIDTAFAGVAIAASDSELNGFTGGISGTGTTRAMAGSAGDISTFLLTITGTLNTVANTASGTWDFTVYDMAYGTDDNGTWSAELCP